MNQLNTIYQAPLKNIKRKISRVDGEFLYKEIVQNNPTFLVEIGIAAGFSSSIILAAMETVRETDKSAYNHLHSFDFQEHCFWDKFLATGMLIDQLIPEQQDYYSLHTKNSVLDIGNYLEKGSVEFAFLNSVRHQHPWPTLDLLGLLPYMSPHACICINDINLPTLHPGFNNFGSHYLFEFLDVAKFKSEAEIPNIGSILINYNKRELWNQTYNLLISVPWETQIPLAYLENYKINLKPILKSSKTNIIE